jgi:IrrE N-terminal-like domain
VRARTIPKFIVEAPPKRQAAQFSIPRGAIPEMVEDLLARSEATARQTRERQADVFAAELLMPTTWFRLAMAEMNPSRPWRDA